MNAFRTTVFVAAIAVTGLLGPGCEIADPIIIAVGLPLEVSADLNGGSSWDETETIDIEQEITDVDVEYLDDVQATRVNDVTIRMDAPPAGTSAGSLSYSSPSINGGVPSVLATWAGLSLAEFDGDGFSLLDPPAGVVVNILARTQLLDALQDESGLPVATVFTVTTSGTTSVAVPAGKTLIAKFHYQADVEI